MEEVDMSGNTSLGAVAGWMLAQAFVQRNESMYCFDNCLVIGFIKSFCVLTPFDISKIFKS